MAITIKDIIKMKEKKEKISMITAYDYYTGKLVVEAGIDIVLVGDSLGMVIQGHQDTLPVTLEQMIYHTKIVKRGFVECLLVTDMPFMSYQAGVAKALDSAGRIMKESGAQAVKLEGGKRVIPQVKALVAAGIPVMGHLGLTPQSVNQFGGYKVQGKEYEQARKLYEDALALEEVGVFSVVLETIPRELAALISRKLTVPTIGIGAGPECDGQVLVLHDLLGFDDSFYPKFARQYANLNKIIKNAVGKYITEVKQTEFPRDQQSFHMQAEIIEKLTKELK